MAIKTKKVFLRKILKVEIMNYFVTNNKHFSSFWNIRALKSSEIRNIER